MVCDAVHYEDSVKQQERSPLCTNRPQWLATPFTTKTLLLLPLLLDKDVHDGLHCEEASVHDGLHCEEASVHDGLHWEEARVHDDNCEEEDGQTTTSPPIGIMFNQHQEHAKSSESSMPSTKATNIDPPPTSSSYSTTTSTDSLGAAPTSCHRKAASLPAKHKKNMSQLPRLASSTLTATPSAVVPAREPSTTASLSTTPVPTAANVQGLIPCSQCE